MGTLTKISIFVLLALESVLGKRFCHRRSDCICKDDIPFLSAAYVGSKYVTANGLLCQPWNISGNCDVLLGCSGLNPVILHKFSYVTAINVGWI